MLVAALFSRRQKNVHTAWGWGWGGGAKSRKDIHTSWQINLLEGKMIKSNK